ncbi:MAG: DUF1223 domain-containing protein [Rhodospirillales bacterium]|nr:DUF1223 domain-containing protein [Rhodospirillales bacterium]
MCVLIALSALPATARDLTVVELYTSQGCSSCPPADKFLGELAKRDDVLALSFHVDYWDYIGWKDTFASPANTERQRAYARRFGIGYVYTPQMVVHGTAQMTGSNRPAVLNGIAQAQTMPAIQIKLRRDAGGVSASLPAKKGAEQASVYAVLFDREHSTSIRRGENGGRQITYSNVVRKLERLTSWNGEAMTVALPVGEQANDACAVIVQSDMSGMILGAATLDLRN